MSFDTSFKDHVNQEKKQKQICYNNWISSIFKKPNIFKLPDMLSHTRIHTQSGQSSALKRKFSLEKSDYKLTQTIKTSGQRIDCTIVHT